MFRHAVLSVGVLSAPLWKCGRTHQWTPPRCSPCRKDVCQEDVSWLRPCTPAACCHSCQCSSRESSNAVIRLLVAQRREQGHVVFWAFFFFLSAFPFKVGSPWAVLFSHYCCIANVQTAWVLLYSRRQWDLKYVTTLVTVTTWNTFLHPFSSNPNTFLNQTQEKWWLRARTSVACILIPTRDSLRVAQPWHRRTSGLPADIRCHFLYRTRSQGHSVAQQKALVYCPVADNIVSAPCWIRL